MRQLKDTELYNLRMGANEQQLVGQAIRLKLNQNVGNIAPEQIENELFQLKSKAKGSFYPLLSDALALYETRGLIRLFNLGNTERGRSPIPTFMPFVPAMARNRVKENNSEISAQNAQDKVLFMNMYRIGNWAADEAKYNGISPMDLYVELESGVIMYKMLIQNMSEKVFSNKVVVEVLSRIYANMFAQTVYKCKIGTFGDDFLSDAAYYLIAKFFLKYILGKANDDIVGSYAMLSIKNRTARAALESFEEAHNINFDSLTDFLKTFGLAFYNEPITVMEFEDQWMKAFGETAAYAVEYVPYLIHILFAIFHGSMLGGTIRAYKKSSEYNKLGLPKLYTALINEIK